MHDFSNYAAAGATDLRAVETIGEVLVGTDMPFVVTSGTAGVKPGHVLTEDDTHGADSPRGPSVNFLCIVEEQLLKITSNFALFLERVEGKQMLNEEVWKSAKSGQSTTNYSGLR